MGTRAQPFAVQRPDHVMRRVADLATSSFGAEGDGLSLYLDDPDGNTTELKGPSR